MLDKNTRKYNLVLSSTSLQSELLVESAADV